jgi:ATP sulfurylase
VELHNPLSLATLIYCDNVSAVYLSTDPVQHQRTKHVEIDIQFVRKCVAVGDVCPSYPNDFPVCRHLYQVAALLSVLGVSVLSHHLH